MGGNSFGKRFVVTSFGESHGPALGVVIDGCPAQLEFDMQLLLLELQRRRPGLRAAQGGDSGVVSSRNELDQPEILSGVFNGKTLGTPIAILIRNQDQRSQDYDVIEGQARRGHADQVWREKFGISDHRGGGRSSGRETVSRVAAGAVAKMLLRRLCPQTEVRVFAEKIGPYQLGESELVKIWETSVDDYQTRFPSEKENEVVELLKSAKISGNSYGGIIGVRIRGLGVGLGQPVFHKLKADLASALMGIGSFTGIEFGRGFEGVTLPGVDFHSQHESIYGGIQGGISTGQEVVVRLAVKPTSSILDVSKMGRHDPCVLIRAIPVVEAMISLVLADHQLWMKTDRIDKL